MKLLDTSIMVEMLREGIRGGRDLNHNVNRGFEGGKRREEEEG